MTDHMQIVVAWATKTALVPTGRYVTRDLNRFPEFKADWEGNAAMWLRKGTDADVAKAQAFIDHDFANDPDRVAAAVHTFPRTERDPLGRARAHAVHAAKNL